VKRVLVWRMCMITVGALVYSCRGTLLHWKEFVCFFLNNPIGIYRYWYWRYWGNMIWGVPVGLAAILSLLFFGGCGDEDDVKRREKKKRIYKKKEKC